MMRDEAKANILKVKKGNRGGDKKTGGRRSRARRVDGL
jgi:hypothetical protein